MRARYCSPPHNFPPDHFDVLDNGFIDVLVKTPKEEKEAWESGLEQIRLCIRDEAITQTDRGLLLDVVVEGFKRWIHPLKANGRTRTQIFRGLGAHQDAFFKRWHDESIEKRAFNIALSNPEDVVGYYQTLFESAEKMMASGIHKEERDGAYLMLSILKCLGKAVLPINFLGDLNVDQRVDNSTKVITSGEVTVPMRVNIMHIKGLRDRSTLRRLEGVQINGQIQTIEMEPDAMKSEEKSRIESLEINEEVVNVET